MVALHREFKAQGLAMIGVSFEEEPGVLEAFGRNFQIAFPLAVEEQERMEKLFGIRGCPSTVLIDRQGRLAARMIGQRDWGSEPARKLVRLFLEGREGVAAQGAPPSAATQASRKAIRFLSALRPNDPKVTEMLDQAAGALKAKDEVVILFDGQSVGALRMSVRTGKKTPLDAVDFKRQERTAVAKRLGVRLSAAPRNQLQYIQQLAQAGAKVFVNSNAVRFYGLAEGEIHPVAKPLPMPQMEEIVDQSDACVNYGGQSPGR